MESDSRMRYEFVETNRLRPNGYNPNQMTDGQLAALRRTIARDGFCGVVLANETRTGLVIVDGEHRWRAARILRIASIPCLIGSFSEETARALTVKLNQIHGYWNAPELVSLLESVSEPLEDLGFSEHEFARELELAAKEVTGGGCLGEKPKSIKSRSRQYVGFMLTSKQQRLLRKALDRAAQRLDEPMLSRSDALEQVLSDYLCALAVE